MRITILMLALQHRLRLAKLGASPLPLLRVSLLRLPQPPTLALLSPLPTYPRLPRWSVIPSWPPSLLPLSPNPPPLRSPACRSVRSQPHRPQHLRRRFQLPLLVLDQSMLLPIIPSAEPDLYPSWNDDTAAAVVMKAVAADMVRRIAACSSSLHIRRIWTRGL
jgi:hypothetical protein